MRILKSKLIRKIGILGFSLVFSLISIIAIDNKFHLFSKVTGIDFEIPSLKFCDDANNSDQKNCTSFIPEFITDVSATVASPYQKVDGNVSISGNVNSTGVISAAYIITTPQDSTYEGGEMRFAGTGSNGNFQIDNYAGNARIHTLGAGKSFQILGGDGLYYNGTSTGFYLGKGCKTDNWARLTTGSGTCTYHDLAIGALWAGGSQKYDLAEVTPSKPDDKLEQGDVVVIDKEGSTKVTKSLQPYDSMVYGIVSSYDQASMVIGGDTDPQSAPQAKDKTPIALVGRVQAKVSTENGPIEAGDLLTTSTTPGHLMKCTDKLKCLGAVAGKALEPFSEVKGKILVLVTLQ